nr:GAF domain-containing protein [Leptolyngbya sp. FACHB-541]
MARLPANETERLAALRRYKILDTPHEAAFDRITRLAAKLFDMPIALISLVDESRAWFKSCVGFGASEVPRDDTLCSFAVLTDEPLIIPDARLDDRFACNPFVQSEPGVRFYAGAPLLSQDGFNLGTLCLLDSQPRDPLTTDQQATLVDLAAMVVDELELRLAAHRIAQVDAALLEVTQGVSSVTGDAFFDALIQHFAKVLNTDYVYIGLIEGDDPKRMRTIATCAHGQIVESLTYPLQDTPCWQAIEQRKICCYPRNVQAYFPHAPLLKPLSVESYIAVPFFDANGTPLGLLGVMDGEPLEHVQLAESLLTIFAERIVTELERQRTEVALRESEEKYRTLFESIDEGFCIVEMILNVEGTPVDYRFVQMNPAFFRLTGLPKDALGKTARELVPELEAFWFEVYGKVALTGEAMHFENYSKPMNRWFDVHASRVGDAESRRVALVFNNITERKRTEEILRRTAELDAFRVSLADALRPLADPVEIQATASRVLGKYLGANRVAYFEVRGADYVVERDYVNGSEALAGSYPIDAFGPKLLAAYRSGCTVTVPDVAADLNLSPTQRAAYTTIQIGAYIGIPLIKEGEFVAGLAVHASSARTWTADEVALAEEVAERTWAAVERARAEAALREREQRLSIATAAAQLGIFEWKVPEDITIWENERQYELFGLTPADGSVSAQEFFENYLHPDDAEALTAKLTEAMQTGSLFQASYRICCKDGITRWLEVNGQFELAADGSPLRFVGVNADITDRKQAEATIVQREAQFRRLADAMPQQVWITDAQGNTQYVNQQWTTYTGLTLEQTQDIHYAIQVIHPDDFEATGQLWSTALATGLPYQAEFRLKYQADHTYRWFLSRAIAIRDEQGQIVQWFGTSTDIEEFRRAQAEREQLLQREQTARESAENANRIKDEFLAVLSHELRSPLNPILGWSTLLLGKKLDEAKTAQALTTIQRNARLQSELIEDLLDVARILRGKLSLNVAAVNLVSIIQAAMETVRLAAEAKSIQVEASLPPDVGLVLGDSTRLQQVIWNLLSNAVKFTPNGGQVNIRLESLGSHAQITVSDTGQGIEPEFLPYVFDHFRQANAATTRKFGGLGLGLAIVRHLVELHGGTVRVESLGVGIGATFTIRLPLMPLQTIPHQNGRSSESSSNLNGVQVLVVDDEPDSREFIAFVLEQAGANVMTATSAHEALITSIQSKPDVIISDIGMPEVDGYMLMQQVRALPPDQGGQVPAIALTAYAGDFNQQQALQAGFQQHVSKPVEPEVLIRAIASLLRDPKC